jgi:hypothetical protein
MALPDLRHFGYGVYRISSDPVEVLVGEAWVLAVYTDKGWFLYPTDGAKLRLDIAIWRVPCPNTPAPPNPRSQRPRRKVAKSEG